MIEFGDGYVEMDVIKFFIGRYKIVKGHAMAWKKMGSQVQNSTMKFDDFLRFSTAVFKKDGLLDKTLAWMKDEASQAETFFRGDKLWEMQLKAPKYCDVYGSCSQIDNWVTPRGLSANFADFNEFRNNDQKNQTLDQLTTDLAFFKSYERNMENYTINDDSVNTFDGIMKLLKNETAIAEMLD